MKIHEYQAADLFRQYGIPAAEGRVAETPEQAQKHASEIGGTVVVKAQVHAGGRGKAGGVKLAKSAAEAKEVAGKILGMKIQGITVKKVLVAPAVKIKKETYVGVTLDRASQKPVMMVSAAGGVDIEEVAAKSPEKILKESVEPLLGLQDHQARKLAWALFDKPEAVKTAAQTLKGLYRAFAEKDCSLAEVNPLVELESGEVRAIDAKIVFDDNALFRHPDVEKLRDLNEEDANEIQAKEFGLSFVSLDGDIGCLVNGAGLAMATLDAVKLHGGEPANFLDVGGSSDPKKVVAALRIITSNPKVKGILFNIFGGITRCDDIANGILTALSQMKIELPIVIRLTGTNEEQARKILAEAATQPQFKSTRMIPAASMDEAVKRVIAEASPKTKAKGKQ